MVPPAKRGDLDLERSVGTESVFGHIVPPP